MIVGDKGVGGDVGDVGVVGVGLSTVFDFWSGGFECGEGRLPREDRRRSRFDFSEIEIRLAISIALGFSFETFFRFSK